MSFQIQVAAFGSLLYSWAVAGNRTLLASQNGFVFLLENPLICGMALKENRKDNSMIGVPLF